VEQPAFVSTGIAATAFWKLRFFLAKEVIAKKAILTLPHLTTWDPMMEVAS